MTTSVPQVLPFDEGRRQVARIVELGLYLRKATGDTEPMKRALSVTRLWFEAVVKPACNEGKADPKWRDAVGAQLEKLERWYGLD